MVLPFVASLLATGNLSKQAIDLTKKYHIAPDTTLVNNASAGWPVINNCIDTYCAAQNSSKDGTAGCLHKTERLEQFAFYPNKAFWNEHQYDDDGAQNITFNRPNVCTSCNATICNLFWLM